MLAVNSALITLVILFSSLTAQAQRLSDPVPALRANSLFCTVLDDEKHSMSCMHEVSKANWASISVLGICEEQTWARNQAACVIDFLNYQVSNADVAACRGYAFPEEKVDCLKKLRRHVNAHTYFKVPVNTGKLEFAEMCNALFFKSDKDKCLELLAKLDFVAPKAVSVCRNNFLSDKDKVKCLETIVNRWYFDFEVEKCQSLFADKNKLYCFAGFSRRYRLVSTP